MTDSNFYHQPFFPRDVSRLLSPQPAVCYVREFEEEKTAGPAVPALSLALSLSPSFSLSLPSDSRYVYSRTGDDCFTNVRRRKFRGPFSWELAECLSRELLSPVIINVLLSCSFVRAYEERGFSCVDRCVDSLITGQGNWGNVPRDSRGHYLRNLVCNDSPRDNVILDLYEFNGETIRWVKIE